MSNVQDATIIANSVGTIQDIEKLRGNDGLNLDTSGRDVVLADTVIQKIRISNCDNMRRPLVSLSGGGKPTPSKTVISDQNCDTDIVESALVADKYQLFEQVIGSSLFRCVDVKTKQELVCKVSCFVTEITWLSINIVVCCQSATFR